MEKVIGVMGALDVNYILMKFVVDHLWRTVLMRKWSILDMKYREEICMSAYLPVKGKPGCLATPIIMKRGRRGKAVIRPIMNVDLIEKMNLFDWHFGFSKNTEITHRHTTQHRVCKEYLTLEQFVLGAPLGTKILHIDGDPLNFTRKNLVIDKT